MSDPLGVFIDAVLEALTGAREETQADYALAGPKK